MKQKTSELTGTALDWAVAKCEVPSLAHDNKGHIEHFKHLYNAHVLHQQFHYSTNWSQAGQIIEREGICVDLLLNGQWIAASRKVEGATMYSGPTPLVAAMRCYVASKLGDEVDIPEELC